MEDEKKLADEEISQLRQDIYKLNDKIIQMQVSGPVSPIKGSAQHQPNDLSKDLSYSLTHDKAEIEAIQRFYDLKDANVRRQADMQKLRERLENLQCDFKLHQTSNKIKLQNIQSKIQSIDETGETRVDSSTRCAESGEDFTIDGDQMITDQITGSLEILKTIER